MPELNESVATTSLQEFMEKWNRGDLEGACEMYAEDASFITAKGLVQGKKAILSQYRTSYADRKAMGQLTLTLIEFRSAPGDNPTMATAILRYNVKIEDEEDINGYCLETYLLRDGKISIAQDASV